MGASRVGSVNSVVSACINTDSRIPLRASSDPPLDMLSTLVSLILLLPVLAAKRSTSCADASIAAVRQEFQALNVGLVVSS